MLTGLDDDVSELRLVGETALRGDGELVGDRLRHRLSADDAGRYLKILLADRLHDVARREPARRDLVGIEPDAHCVVAGAEHDDLARAGKSPQLIPNIERRVV